MKYSLATGIQRLSMPLLDVSINDIKLTFLIDTGATHNVIASFVYEQIKHCFTLLEETNKIMGVDGIYQETPYVSTTLALDNMKIQTIFNVIDMNETVIKLQEEIGLQLHGFLGIPFLKNNKCIIDFRTLEIIIE